MSGCLVFFRILRVCHGVLYKQLSAWMLHGLLLDVKGEFFIEMRQKEAAVSSLSGCLSSEGQVVTLLSVCL